MKKVSLRWWKDVYNENVRALGREEEEDTGRQWQVLPHSQVWSDTVNTATVPKAMCRLDVVTLNCQGIPRRTTEAILKFIKTQRLQAILNRKSNAGGQNQHGAGSHTYRVRQGPRGTSPGLQTCVFSQVPNTCTEEKQDGWENECLYVQEQMQVPSLHTVWQPIQTEPRT